MGITGLLRHLGPGQRVSLSALAAQFFVKHNRPLRLAVDISIWLFQIQAGQGGSNPALRTFYYRLVRLISLNIHPLFVFDGPNKPLFKRNKRVGGPGVRVATIPEFLAKQLLKQFGTPLHIAPGEAEAECALLQRQGVVDAVLSDDVDTMMFGSSFTLRNWSTEGTSKTPTHVNAYRAQDVRKSSGVDREGMILVALMSGGDYLPAGIMGCGPKFAVDAAKAGFARDLCALDTTDTAGYAAWRARLQEELRTNVSKFFTRRNTSLIVPDTFPSVEVLGYYTTPCVSSSAKVEELRQSLVWDQPLDFDALRAFAGDAFEWYNLTGAKHFIRSLAPALLARKLRLEPEPDHDPDTCSQDGDRCITSVHGQRQHSSVDNAVEIRVSYTPAALVPIDLAREPEDDAHVGNAAPSSQTGTIDLLTDAVDAIHDSDDEVLPPSSPRKRKVRPFDPAESSKLWLLREWVQYGCPSKLENYEAQRAAKERLQSKSTARRAGGTTAARGSRGRNTPSMANTGMPTNALMRHAMVSKSTTHTAQSLDDAPPTLDGKSSQESAISKPQPQISIAKPAFVLPSTQIPDHLLDGYKPAPLARARDSTPRTPSRRKQKNSNPVIVSSPNHSILKYMTPTKSQRRADRADTIDLTTSPMSARQTAARHVNESDLPANDSTRRFVSPPPRHRTRFRKSLSMPTYFDDTLPATADKLARDASDLIGTAMQPIELSPNPSLPRSTPDSKPQQLSPRQVQTQPLQSAFTPHKHARLDRDTVARSAALMTNATRSSDSGRKRDTFYGHRVSQVEFLDLTGT